MPRSFGPRAALAESAAFFRSHELHTFAKELPPDEKLSAQGHSRLDQARKEGFHSVLAFPSTATQKVHFDAIVKQLASAPAFGLSKKEQYSPPGFRICGKSRRRLPETGRPG